MPAGRSSRSGLVPQDDRRPCLCVRRREQDPDLRVRPGLAGQARRPSRRGRRGGGPAAAEAPAGGARQPRVDAVRRGVEQAAHDAVELADDLLRVGLLDELARADDALAEPLVRARPPGRSPRPGRRRRRRVRAARRRERRGSPCARPAWSRATSPTGRAAARGGSRATTRPRADIGSQPVAVQAFALEEAHEPASAASAQRRRLRAATPRAWPTRDVRPGGTAGARWREGERRQDQAEAGRQRAAEGHQRVARCASPPRDRLDLLAATRPPRDGRGAPTKHFRRSSSQAAAGPRTRRTSASGRGGPTAWLVRADHRARARCARRSPARSRTRAAGGTSGSPPSAGCPSSGSQRSHSLTGQSPYGWSPMRRGGSGPSGCR